MTTRIVVAPDKFKGSLTAAEAAAAMQAGCRAALGDVEVAVLPVSDGGEGMLTVLAARGGQERSVEVHGPLGDRHAARYVSSGDAAFIETAEACGLGRVPTPSAHTAASSSSYGVGELILDALDQGHRRIYLGLGGSACTDGGAGMAQALGVRLLDGARRPVPPGGAGLASVAHIDSHRLDPRVSRTHFYVAHDVDNPLLGPSGAAAVYAPQKGANPETVTALEAALSRYEERLRADLDRDVAGRPGAGAAGGLGAGAFAFLDAGATSGAELMLEIAGAHETVRRSDLVLVGEGKLDAQTLHGKAPRAVAGLARELEVPCLAVAGVVEAGPQDLRLCGISRAFSLTEAATGAEDAMQRAADLLERVTGHAVTWWSRQNL